MELIHSKLENKKLLHLIHRLDDFRNRSEIVEPNEYLQVSSLELMKNQSFLAHRHIWKELDNNLSLAQESWVVIRGKVEVSFFDLDDSLIQTFELNQGDISITLYGGHSYKVLEDSLVYEFKTGPYFGQARDKVFIDDTK